MRASDIHGPIKRDITLRESIRTDDDELLHRERGIFGVWGHFGGITIS